MIACICAAPILIFFVPRLRFSLLYWVCARRISRAFGLKYVGTGHMATPGLHRPPTHQPHGVGVHLPMQTNRQTGLLRQCILLPCYRDCATHLHLGAPSGVMLARPEAHSDANSSSGRRLSRRSARLAAATTRRGIDRPRSVMTSQKGSGQALTAGNDRRNVTRLSLSTCKARSSGLLPPAAGSTPQCGGKLHMKRTSASC